MSLSPPDTFVFEDSLPLDSVPPVSDVEHPCLECGRDVQYGGRGPIPKRCPDHRKQTPHRGTRLTGNANNLATQAAKTLVQINQFVGLAVSAMGFFKSGGTLIAYQETFEAQAYAALITDPELCKSIVSVGSASAKVSLFLAYGGMGLAVAPVVASEYRAKKEAKLAEMDESLNDYPSTPRER